ncbi:MAG: 7TM domain-containing protein [Candidatus Eisenbacteria bacterium]
MASDRATNATAPKIRWRRKRMTKVRVWTLVLTIGIPLVIIALKHSPWAIAEPLRELLSLAGTGDEIRGRVGNVLLVPLGAAIVVFFRIALGIRVLGPFRSVLLAMAFQVTGIPLGIFFLGLVIAVIVAARPVIRKLRLPYFSRLSVTLSTVAAIIMMTLVFARALGLESLGRAAYFPIVVLALTADGFARTLRREGKRSALWRGSMTALVAVLITALARVPTVLSLVVHYPELLLAEIGGMILISYFLGFRALAFLNPPLPKKRKKKGRKSKAGRAGLAAASSQFPKAPTVVEPVPDLEAAAARTDEPGPAGLTPETRSETKMKIAVVRNRKNEGVLARFGSPTKETYGRSSVQSVMDSLRSEGHEVKVMEGDMTLLAELAKFMPADPVTAQPTGLVFNMSYGVQGEGRYLHVPGMLEMAGVPYTGSTPRAHGICLDKITTKLAIQSAGVPTPRFCSMWTMDDFDATLRFPLIVKPRHESTSLGLALVHDRAELATAVEHIVGEFTQDALVEEYIDGREVAIGILGNGDPEILPPVELDFRGRAVKILTKPDKFHKTEDEPDRICPAPLDEPLKLELDDIARRVWRACGCRDYARIDIRIDENGRPFVLEINSMASLGQGGAYVLAARTAGYSFPALVNRIVDVAHERYFGCPAPRENGGVSTVPATQSRNATEADSIPQGATVSTESLAAPTSANDDNVSIPTTVGPDQVA